MGRSRRRQAARVASVLGAPFALDLGEFDDEDGVLAGQAHQHDEADLGEDVHVEMGQRPRR